jgi:hypothetical protein
MRTGPDDDSPGADLPGESRLGEPRPGRPGPGEPRPGGLRPTKAITLILSALLTAALAWVTMSRFFGSIPDVTWLAGVTLAALAVVEAIAARNTKARIEQRPRAGVLNPLFIARLAVLAKASSLAGAIFAGAYGGVAAWALSERGVLHVADANLAPAAGGLVGGLALVAAALLLERACRVPEPPDDGDQDATAGPPPPPRR